MREGETRDGGRRSMMDEEGKGMKEMEVEGAGWMKMTKARRRWRWKEQDG